MTTILAKIKMRRGTAAQWAASNPVLAEGELAFETDTGRTKIGNGVTGYSALPSYPTLDEMLEAQGIVQGAVEDAEAAEMGAAASATAAVTSATASQTAATAAGTSAAAASASATAASISAAAAAGSASDADNDRVAAQAASTTANNAKGLAQAAQLAAEAARDQAQAAQTGVAGVVAQAATYAGQAYQSAVSAETDAAATAANRQATFADREVTTSDRTAAAASASAAAASEVAADASADAAGASALAAAGSATTAQSARDVAVAAKTDAEGSATAASTSANAASASASAAASSATAAANSATTSTNNASATASDRTATGLDRTAAAASASAAAASQTAAATSATAAASSASAASASAATANTKAGEASTSATNAAASAASAEASKNAAATSAYDIETSYGALGNILDKSDQATAAATVAESSAEAANFSQLSAAQSALIAAQYSVASGLDTATRNAQAAASLAQGYAASASSVAQQDLSGITAQALHRSPNAITAMAIYDTSKDSDGGAWTEKCQHTSWYNEPLSGKWLGAQESELQARNIGATLGSELIANSDFLTNDLSLWSGTGATLSIVSGQLQVVASTAYGAAFSSAIATVAGTTYALTVKVSTSSPWAAQVGTSQGGGQLGALLSRTSGTFTKYFTATSATTYIRFGCDNLQATLLLDAISFKPVIALNTASNDYFQLTTDGKFYRLWRNLLARSAEFDNGVWGKAHIAVAPNAGIAPDGTLTADVLTPNTTASRHWVSNGSLFVGYTLSVYAKANVGALNLWLGDNALGARVYFNLTNGTIASGSGGAIEAVGGGWYRCSILNVTSGGITSGNTAWIGASVGTDANAAGNGTDSILVWGAQLEYGSTPTTYEPKAAEGSISEVFRGNKADFPRLAALVGETNCLVIYDLTEPGRPMWMRFNSITNSGYAGMLLHNTNCTGIAAANGNIVTCGNGSWQSYLTVLNFIKETGRFYGASGNASLHGFWRSNFAGRLTAGQYDLLTMSWENLASNSCNAVAMAVLPDAPIDPATGLRVPTIAVATSGGISIVKHNGAVVSSGNTGTFAKVAITPFMLSAYINGTGIWQYAAATTAANALPVAPNSLGAGFGFGYPSATFGPDFTLSGGHAVGFINSLRSRLLAGRAAGVKQLVANEGRMGAALASSITNTHNTGWMAGDIRRAYLSDVSTASLVAANVIQDGNFGGTGVWALTSGVTISGGKASFNLSVNGGPSISQTIAGLAAGATFRLRFTVSDVQGTLAAFFVRLGDNSNQVSQYNYWAGTYEFTLYKGSLNDSFSFAIAGGDTTSRLSVSNITLELAVNDRSYKSRSAAAVGTITRAALATGTSLVGYSGFSAANYLRETYSADLDFGTGEWSCSAWVNVPGTLSDANFPVSSTEIVSNGDFSGGSTGWTLSGSLTSVSSSQLRLGDTAVIPGTAKQTGVTLVANRAYKVSFDVVSRTSGSVRLFFGPGAAVATASISAVGSYSEILICPSSQTEFTIQTQSNPADLVIDNVSIRELGIAPIADRSFSSAPRLALGVSRGGALVATAFDGTTTRTVTTSNAYNTATWLKAEACYTLDGTLSIRVNGREVVATRGNPLLSLSSRYNQVLYSQDFANAAWLVTAGFSSKASTAVTDPLGGTTACEIAFIAANGSLQQNSVFTVGKTYTISFWSRRDAGSNVLRVATNTGTSLATFSPTSSWQKFTFTVTVSSGNHILFQDTSSSGWTNVQFAFVQVEEGSTAKAYQRVGAATDFDFQAPLTIGNSYATDAPFPGSIALLKLSATVPSYEQSQFMYEQEKQLFRAGAQSVLPDSGSIVDMAYDDATDRWVTISASNEGYWTGLVRNSVTPVPAGSFSRIVAGSGVELAARSTTNPGVDVTIPAYGLREELVKRAEAAARLTKELVTYDYVGGFTAATTSGSTVITSVANLIYPASYIGARISGSGIPANTTIVAVSGSTIYLSAAATATATGVSISFLDFALPVGMEARTVMSAGSLKQEGSTKDFTRLYDGFIETIRFGVAPGATAWVQIQATRGTMQ